MPQHNWMVIYLTVNSVASAPLARDATHPGVATLRLPADRQLPAWSCTAWGLSCPRNYSRGGELLPRLFTLTLAMPGHLRAGLISRQIQGGIFSATLSVITRFPG